MKRLLLLCGFSLALFGADLTAVRSVYVMPMARGFDQHLASRLTSDQAVQVVTDPHLADAIFTDRLGEAFDLQLERLAPPAGAEPKESKEQPKPAGDAAPAPTTIFTPPANKLENPAVNSSFGRGRGTYFLVDPKSKAVVWSVYIEPAGSDGKNLDRMASDIVSRLKHDMSGSGKKK